MSDLVEQLFAAAYNEDVGPLCNEAATQLERHRALLWKMMDGDRYQGVGEFYYEIRELLGVDPNDKEAPRR